MDWRRIVVAIGVVAFVVIVSILIFSIDWGGGGVRDEIREVNIADYADTDARARMTIRGEINSDEEHEELQITVSQARVVGELLTGYQGSVTRSTASSSNEQAYKSFLSALHNARFTARKLPPANIQYDGACPEGKRYTFEFIDAGEDAPRSSWSTTCSKRIGTFDGDLTLTRNLFFDQIPKEQFDSLTEDSQF